MTTLIILFLSVLVSFQTKKEVKVNFPFSVELTSFKGKKVNTSTFQNDNKMVFIYFLHTGCSPCMQMFDAVRDNYKEWDQKTNCKMIAVVCEERNERNIQLIESKKWPIEVYFDQDYLLFAELCRFHDKKDMQFSFPSIFVFDEKWQLLDKLKGAKRKLRDGIVPDENQEITINDFVIDLDVYYNLFREWRLN
jgi:peroxiredoxin